MNFTVYSKDTGQILRTGSCPDNQFDAQAQGNDIVEGIYPDDKYYWDNGFKAIPQKPDGFYEFNYSTKTWVLNSAQIISNNRTKRNNLLLSSDWTQLPDVALTVAKKQEWATYRQALRDMTEQAFINGIFPEKPL